MKEPILKEPDLSSPVLNELPLKDPPVANELPAAKELTAVKEGNVYTIDINMLDRQGYRNAQGIEELAKIFHPEAFE